MSFKSNLVRMESLLVRLLEILTLQILIFSVKIDFLYKFYKDRLFGGSVRMSRS